MRTRHPKRPSSPNGRTTAAPSGARVPSSLLALALLALAAALVYSNTLFVPFVFDDQAAIVDNPTIRKLWPPWPMLHPPGGGITVQGRPIVNISLAINYAIHGVSLPGYHLFNLAVHILNAWLLFGIVASLWPRPKPSTLPAAALPESPLRYPFFIALLWLLHPLCTQAVTYVVQRAESMAALCYLLTLYALLRSALPAGPPDISVRLTGTVRPTGGRPDPMGRANPPGEPFIPALHRPATAPIETQPVRRCLCKGGYLIISWPLVAILSCAIGMATKETMVTAPLAALLFDRAYLAGSWRAVYQKRRGLHAALVATLGILAIVLPSFSRDPQTGLSSNVSPWSYLLTQTGVITHYLRLSVWPDALCFDYRWPLLHDVLTVWPQLALVTGLLAVALFLWRRDPRLGFPALLVFLYLAPSSSIMPVADVAFEHRMYVPLAALCVLLVAAAVGLTNRIRSLPSTRPEAARRLGTAHRALDIALFMLALILGARTFVRNADYRTALTLWNATIRVNPGNARAWYNRGYVFELAGNPEAAEQDFIRALTIDPNYAGPYYNMGNLDLNANRLEQAIDHYTHAIQREAGNVLPYYNRGIARIRLGRANEAMADFDACIRIAPGMANAYLKRADIHAQFDRYADAIADYTRAIQCDANLADAWHNRAAAHAMLGNIPAARNDLIQCRRLGSEPAPELINMLGGLAPAR